jgi:hypothetical protein
VFHKISDALKDEEYAAFTFETFVFNDFKLPETCCYIKKDFVSYGAFVGSKDFWNRTNKIIKNISSTFESIRKFNSSYLFLKIVDIFYKDAIDLTENINSKTENNLVIVNN